MNNQPGKVVTSILPMLAVLLGLIAPFVAVAAKINTGSDGVAIHGFDAVAYFLEGRAVRGTSNFRHDWQDAEWQFSSEANKNLFAADPERYAPQYGGFCSVCLALDGELADANPRAWTIVEGKLYFNYSMYQRTQWRIRANLYVKYGDEEWAKVLGREKKHKTSARRFKTAIFPFAGIQRSSAGQIIEADLGEISQAVVKENSAFDLVYSYYAKKTTDNSTRIPNSRITWKGYERIVKLDESAVFSLGAQHALDTIFLYKIDHGPWNNAGPYDFAWVTVEGYLFNIKERKITKLTRDIDKAKEVIQRLLSDFVDEHGSKPTDSDESYRLAVIGPNRPNADTRELELGGDVFKYVLQQSGFSISYADEPYDPSAWAYLNRGGRWPYPSTNVPLNEAWEQKDSIDKYYPIRPNLERLYRARQDLKIDAVLLWDYRRIPFGAPQWPVEIYVIDVVKQQFYSQTGTNYDVQMLVQQALSDFAAGRKP